MVNGVTMEHLKDYLSIPQYFLKALIRFKINSLTYLGYGIDDPAYSDYDGKNVKGQNLIIYDGSPRTKMETSGFQETIHLPIGLQIL
jgi:hypothetical protein